MSNTPKKKNTRSSRSNKSKGSHNRYEEELKAPPKEKDAELIPTEELSRDARQREKKQPLLKRIAKAMSKEETTFKELIINSEPLERRMAFLDDGVLQKFEVEKTDQEQMVGAVFKGRIQNHEPGIKADGRYWTTEECISTLLGYRTSRTRRRFRSCRLWR